MRVRFAENQQRVFLDKVQRVTEYSAVDLANLLGVSSRTLRDWRRERWQMGEEHLIRLCELAQLPRPPGIALLPEHWNVQQAGRLGGLRRFSLHGALGTIESRRRGGHTTQARLNADPERQSSKLQVRKLIRYPSHSEQLAEFIGIFLGDGGFRNAWQITISFNIHGDCLYAGFISQLIEQLFALKSTCCIRHARGAGDLIITSTALVEFLEQMGLSRGPKIKTQPKVPQWITSDSRYRIACLRGLIDTDGSIYEHRYRVNGKMYAYPKLAFCSVLPSLRQFVVESLQGLRIATYHNPTAYQVFVSSRAGVRQYLDTVGTNNPRYRERFLRLIGEVPERPIGVAC